MTGNIKNLIFNKLAITPNSNNNTTAEKPVKIPETKDTYVPTSPPKLSKEEIATLRLDQNNINEINKCCKLPNSLRLVKDKKSGEYKLAKNNFVNKSLFALHSTMFPKPLPSPLEIVGIHSRDRTKLPPNYKLINDESGVTQVVDMSKKDLSLKSLTKHVAE